MRIELRAGLPFVNVRLRHAEQELELHDVLLDTGSAGTLFATDSVSAIGLEYEPEDPLHRIHGVGGSEFVFMKRVDQLAVGEHSEGGAYKRPPREIAPCLRDGRIGS